MYKKINKIFQEKGLTLAIAESCTGGFVSKKITDIPGSSKIFHSGIVSYSNDSKVKLLGVKKLSLKRYGAVSEQVAREMSRGIVRISKADVGVSITGIAGPSGGTPEKPVGTVYIAISYKNKEEIFHYKFRGSRNCIRKKIVKTVARLLLDTVRYVIPTF